MGMGISKGMVMGVFAAIVVLLAGCEEEEKAVADLVETGSVEEVHQEDEPKVEAYWSQPIDSEICQTVGECRDVGDTYGSEYFTSFSGDLKQTNDMSYLSVQAVEDESILAFGAAADEKSVIARYEVVED